MTVIYDTDISLVLRGVSDPVGLPYTVNPLELVDREALLEIREGAPGPAGPQGNPAWPWQWMGDVATFAALQALNLGEAQARRAWRVVAEQAVYLWTGMEFVRFTVAFGATGHQGPPNILTGVATIGTVGSTATASITGTAPNQVLHVQFPRGAVGPVGDPGEPGAISDAEDVGDLTTARQGAVLAWNTTASEWQPIPAPRLGGPWAIAGSQFTGGSNMSASPKTVATMTIPAQTIPWRPIVLGGSLGNQSHVSEINQTRVDVEIRLGAADGPLIGYGGGGGSANQHQGQLYPRWEQPISPASTHATVAANQTAQIYVVVRKTGARNYSIITTGAQLIIGAQPLEGQP
ncbi:hypothetical protein ACFWPK_04270 [Nocardia sp. NPDC058519]|uniref:hypothetical protein n=1 Tax=Nocardia sp. NPDC058519 TaxID=3346535 RepID=UPI003657C249